MEELSVITVFFNPCRFTSLLNNYHIFKNQLNDQGVKLITIECAFNDDEYQIPLASNVYRLRSKSIMWQKERLINYGISKLPKECKYFAWIDCDVLFSQADWHKQAIDKLKKADIIQLFKKVFYLSKDMHKYDPSVKIKFMQSVIWQKIIHKNWLERRINKELPFSAPGFAWAARKEVFDDIGIYDKNIVGSGDTFLVDCYLNSWKIHGFASKFTQAMKADMNEWCEKLKEKNPILDYLPIDIYHLWHGSLKNRGYMERHDIVLNYDYDPKTDIILNNDVYEWNTNKFGMHEEIKKYFHLRKEDQDEIV
jgi:hypothetical protein